MPEKDIARIDATMKHLVALTQEQNIIMRQMLESLTETRTKQDDLTKRVVNLESDKTWMVRLVIGSLIAGAFGVAKALL